MNICTSVGLNSFYVKVLYSINKVEMMNKIYRFFSGLTLLLTCHIVVANTLIDLKELEANCYNNNWSKGDFLELKENKFFVENKTQKKKLALQLLNCLASPDPLIRDEVAFSALSQWLRSDSFSSKVYIEMFNSLSSSLNEPVNDIHGVYKPFVALVLAEVARVDRKKPYLTQLQRKQLVENTVNYFTSLRDYRGFNETYGWRHGIAHTADLMLQLALNPEIDKPLLDKMLVALRSQVVAHNQHFYIYGEPTRIALPVAYIFLRNQHSVDDWQNWLKALTSPEPFNSWNDVYKSQQGLSKRHNSQAFLYALYGKIKQSKNNVLASMIPALENTIKTIN